MENKKAGDNRKFTVREGILLLLATTLIAAIGYYRWEEAGGHIAGDATLYLDARILEERVLQLQWDSLDSVYRALLTVLCTFLGNREDVVLWANQALWILTLLLCYGGIRRILGRKGGFPVLIAVPTLAFCLFSMASAHSAHLAVSVTAALIWIVCGVAAFLRRSRCARENAEKKEKVSPSSVVPASNDQHSQSEEKKTRLLDNPLPVPKRHVRKEMEYAFDPPPEQMEYDLQNYDMNDDYDLHTF